MEVYNNYTSHKHKKTEVFHIDPRLLEFDCPKFYDFTKINDDPWIEKRSKADLIPKSDSKNIVKFIPKQIESVSSKQNQTKVKYFNMHGTKKNQY